MKKSLILSILFFASACLEAKSLKHYLVEDEALKATLDDLFGDATTPEEALRTSGAAFLKDDSQLVATHPALEGWVLKAIPKSGSYKASILSNTLNVGRAILADQIRQLAEKHGLDDIVVPHKFLYKLPKTSGAICDRNTILLAEKIDLVSNEENERRWQYMNVEQEDELLFIIDKVGFLDMTIPNVVFTPTGKMAFIDTEPRWHIAPIDLITPLRTLKRKLLARRGRQKFALARHEK